MPSNQTLRDETSMCSEARSKTSVQTCSALPTTLLDPGIDYGLDEVLAERGDETFARLISHDEAVLFEDREIPVRGAYAYLQPLGHGRGTYFSALEDGDECLLLPLGDVHPRHAVRIPSLRCHGSFFSVLDHRRITGHRDGSHGPATNVVLDGECPTGFLGRRARDA